jgi:hypothetical protein
MNHPVKEKKTKKPDTKYLCLLYKETKTGAKVTSGKPVKIHPH